MISRGLVTLAVVAILATPACRQRIATNGLAGSAACAALDSFVVSAGPPRPFAMSGHARLDVEQFRFRGRFLLEMSGPGDATVEFSGSTLFGGHREDLLVSLVDDTLRVFDRERGRFYEGAALDELIWDGTQTRADWARVVAEILLVRARCEGIAGLSFDEDGVRGLVDGREPFRIVLTKDGRAGRATWTDPIRSGTFDDDLQIQYDWRGEALEEITARLPARGWRLRLSISK